MLLPVPPTYPLAIPRGRRPPKEDLRAVRVAGVDYFVMWDRLGIGGSFFLPTVATVAQVRADLQPIASKLKIQLVVRTRCEFGRYGVRVWRVY